MRRWMYELIYRVPLVPIAWIYGDHRGLIDEVLDAKGLSRGTALDLGCGADLVVERRDERLAWSPSTSRGRSST